MPAIKLADVKLPEFGVPDVRPELSAAVYAERLDRFRKRAAEAGIDIAIVYADREHFANMAYLTGFEPRFEEALLILAPGKTPVVVTGPENQGYAPISPVELNVVLYPPFGLLGQDRTKTPPLADVLTNAGIARGKVVGVAGWKFFGAHETATPDAWVDAPAYVVDTLRALVGDTGRVVNATRILMDASDGMRSINEIDQLAQFEFSACSRLGSGETGRLRRETRHARIRRGAADAAGRPAAQLPSRCCPSGERSRLGLASPSSKTIAAGEPFVVAVGIWGALTCRAGFLVHDAGELPANIRDYVERLAAPYFACAAEWYETVGIGVKGGDIDAMVRRHLGDPFFGLILNPGHLIHLDEWLNTPVYPGSEERLQSGQAIQIDIIPATGSAYCDEQHRGRYRASRRRRAGCLPRPPSGGLEARSRRAAPSWPTSSASGRSPRCCRSATSPGYLPPFMLSPGRALVRS